MASARDLRRPLRMVVAGPIGSGKSTVGAVLSDLGAEVIDADLVGHQVYAPGSEAYDAVAGRWPEVVESGRIDRQALAGIVFKEPSELRRLETLTHPHIARRIEKAVAVSDAPVVAVELPLADDFLGRGWYRLVVLAPEALRHRRAVARGMDPADVRRRMAAQPPTAVWKRNADHVIVNDADSAALRRKVEDWWKKHVG